MSTSHGTILVVDDDANDVFLLQRALHRVAPLYSVQIVGTGDEAIDYLAGRGRFAERTRHPLPALVLLDLKVPRISGFEILEWLRSRAETRRLPVVVMTSAAEAGDVDRAYEHGANSYLVKPLGFERLIELVQAVTHYWLVLNESAVRPPRGRPESEPDKALAT